MLLKLALCVFFSMFNQSKPQPALVFRFSTNKLFVLECETRRYRLVEFTCSDVGSMRSDQRLQPLLCFFRLSWVSSRITHTHTHTHTVRTCSSVSRPGDAVRAHWGPERQPTQPAWTLWRHFSLLVWRRNSSLDVDTATPERHPESNNSNIYVLMSCFICWNDQK